MRPRCEAQPESLPRELDSGTWPPSDNGEGFPAEQHRTAPPPGCNQSGAGRRRRDPPSTGHRSTVRRERPARRGVQSPRLRTPEHGHMAGRVLAAVRWVERSPRGRRARRGLGAHNRGHDLARDPDGLRAQRPWCRSPVWATRLRRGKLLNPDCRRASSLLGDNAVLPPASAGNLGQDHRRSYERRFAVAPTVPRRVVANGRRPTVRRRRIATSLVPMQRYVVDSRHPLLPSPGLNPRFRRSVRRRPSLPDACQDPLAPAGCGLPNQSA